ncbi:MAG: 50S ribosomal protein L30 [Magnetococcales bacterium]|nr:50S ribosomal protein L30 [Magnetococcales bacterium]
MAKQLRIQQFRSQIGQPEAQRRVLRSLGLTKMNQIRTVPDLPPLRGMVDKIRHLVRIIEEQD